MKVLRRPAPYAEEPVAVAVVAGGAEDISRGLAAGESLRAIAARLGRAPATAASEVTGNGGRDCDRAVTADEAAWRRAKRPKEQKLAGSELRRSGEPGQPRQPHGFFADRQAVAEGELGMDPPVAVYASEVDVDLADQVGEPGVADRPFRRRS